jgi:chromosome segregation protein
MRVTRLEIFGFKSFVERFVLNFDKALIGIVGPNGCGKSNIVDALRWVLGESHAKQLRGNVFDDLIFNGSDTMRPLGMAEVSITIRPDEGWFKNSVVDFNSSIENAILRSQIDQDEDIPVELRSDNDNTEESTNPPVNGVQTQVVGLLEIPGLFDCSEIQLTRRLYRSGESEYFINRVPCRLRDMVDLYRLIGLGARGLSIVQQGQIGQIISKKPVERRELLEEAAGISGFRQRVEAAERELEKSSENVARLNDIISEVDKQVKVLRRQAKRAATRKELKDELKQKELALFDAKASRLAIRKRTSAKVISEIEVEIESAKSKLAISSNEEELKRSELEKLEVMLSDKRRLRDELAKVVNQKRLELQEVKVKILTLDEKNKSIEQRQNSIAKREQEIQKILVESNNVLAQLKAALPQLEQGKIEAQKNLSVAQSTNTQTEASEQDFEIAKLEQELAALEAESARNSGILEQIKAAEAELSIKDTAKRSEDRELTSVTISLNKLKSEISAIESQINGLTAHVLDTVGNNTTSEDVQFKANETPLSALLNIPTELQIAVNAILGEKGGYLVSQRADNLLANYLESRSINDSNKRSKIGVIKTQVNTSASNFDINKVKEAAATAVLLSSVISVSEQYKNLCDALFANCYLVDSISEAEALSKMFADKTSWTVVTKNGEVITDWGWFTTSGDGAWLSFARELEQKKKLLDQSEQEYQTRLANVELLSEQLNLLKSDLSTLRSSREQFAQVQMRSSETKTKIFNLRAEKQKQLMAKEREAQLALGKAVGQLSDHLSKISLNEERSARINSEILTLEEQARELILAKENNQNEKMRMEQVLIDLEQKKPDESTAIFENLYESEKELERIENSRNSLRAELGTLHQQLSVMRQTVSSLIEKKQHTEVESERVLVELELIAEELRRIYGNEVTLPALETECEASHLNPDDLVTQINELQLDCDGLRQRLEREGEVDPEAIENHEKESSRLEELLKQRDDLEQSIKTLQRTIRELKEISRARFVDAFSFVSSKFEELVPQLFGGGSGNLELINPEDPLTSGVELFVRPPGKRFRSMELLSGGEKALVATALLVSVFLYRPSPLCVLDEVDAPLDESNLQRFLGLVREISSNTQFLIITHNKQTMSAVDRLIGITMQENGVSTALSVTLEEAEQELAEWVANA